MPKKSSNKDKTAKRRREWAICKEMVWPTAPNQFGRTALIESDISSAFVKATRGYTTLGNQNFLWRAQADGSDLTQSANSDILSAIAITLNAFPGASDFLATFDQYRLRGVQVAITPRNNVEAGSPFLPRLYTAIDYDDANNTGRVQIQQYDTAIESPPGTGVVRCFVPRMAIAAFNSSLFNSYANVKDQWIDAVSPNVAHYGLKICIEGGGGGTILQIYSVQYVAYWEFRATR